VEVRRARRAVVVNVFILRLCCWVVVEWLLKRSELVENVGACRRSVCLWLKVDMW